MTHVRSSPTSNLGYSDLMRWALAQKARKGSNAEQVGRETGISAATVRRAARHESPDETKEIVQ